jgi:hypothetical protein
MTVIQVDKNPIAKQFLMGFCLLIEDKKEGDRVG